MQGFMGLGVGVVDLDRGWLVEGRLELGLVLWLVRREGLVHSWCIRIVLIEVVLVDDWSKLVGVGLIVGLTAAEVSDSQDEQHTHDSNANGSSCGRARPRIELIEGVVAVLMRLAGFQPQRKRKKSQQQHYLRLHIKALILSILKETQRIYQSKVVKAQSMCLHHGAAIYVGMKSKIKWIFQIKGLICLDYQIRQSKSCLPVSTGIDVAIYGAVGVKDCASRGLIVIRLWLCWKRLDPHRGISIDVLFEGRLVWIFGGELLGVPLELLGADEEIGQ